MGTIPGAQETPGNSYTEKHTGLQYNMIEPNNLLMWVLMPHHAKMNEGFIRESYMKPMPTTTNPEIRTCAEDT